MLKFPVEIARWTMVRLAMSSCQSTSTISIGSCLPTTRVCPIERVRSMPALVSSLTVEAVAMICSRLASAVMRAAVLTASP